MALTVGTESFGRSAAGEFNFAYNGAVAEGLDGLKAHLER